MVKSSIRYQTFPRTVAPPTFVEEIVNVFRNHESDISTNALRKGLTSDKVLGHIRSDLKGLGFMVEEGKSRSEKIHRPVLFGENGSPVVSYEIDAYHPEWQVILEVEAGRAWMGNAVYRDLIHACVMVEVKFLTLAVPNAYRYASSGRPVVSSDYEKARELIEALYKQTSFQLPYHSILIGY